MCIRDSINWAHVSEYCRGVLLMTCIFTTIIKENQLPKIASLRTLLILIIRFYEFAFHVHVKRVVKHTSKEKSHCRLVGVRKYETTDHFFEKNVMQHELPSWSNYKGDTLSVNPSSN